MRNALHKLRRVLGQRVVWIGLLVVAAGLGIYSVASGALRKQPVTSVRTVTGKSAQGLKVALTPPHSGIRIFSYQARMSCSDGTTFTDVAFSDEFRLGRGKFSVSYSADRGATRTRVTGRITRKRAYGTINVVERYAGRFDSSGKTPLDPNGPVVCSSGNVSWTAR